MPNVVYEDIGNRQRWRDFVGNKVVITVALIFCMVVSAIIYGVYINVSSSEHIQQVRAASENSLTVKPVERRNVIPVLHKTVTIEPGWRSDIYAKLDGQLDKLLVKLGDHVESGTLLAVIANEELDGQIKQARGNVYSAKASLEQAESDVHRCELLITQNAVSEITLTASRYKREMTRGQLSSAEGSLEQLLAKNENRQVLAARRGEVLKIYVEEGAFARAGVPILNIGDTTTLKVMLPLEGTERELLQQGGAVTLVLNDRQGSQVKAKVVSLMSNPGLAPGAIMAELVIDNAAQALPLGVYSQAVIQAPVIESALMLPSQAVLTRDGQQLVYVVSSDKHAQLRTVKTGYSGDGWTVVYSGVQEGEVVVTHGQSELRDGMMVNVE